MGNFLSTFWAKAVSTRASPKTAPTSLPGTWSPLASPGKVWVHWSCSIASGHSYHLPLMNFFIIHLHEYLQIKCQDFCITWGKLLYFKSLLTVTEELGPSKLTEKPLFLKTEIIRRLLDVVSALMILTPQS